MTVSQVYEDSRKPLLPYAITVRYGRTMSLIEYHRWAHGLDRSPWPTHFRPTD